MSEKTIPGMTTEIFKEFLENTITYVCADNRALIKDIFKGKNDFFGYTFPGLAQCECEVTTDGTIVTHWSTSNRPVINYSVTLADFDDIMMGKMAPMTAMVTKKIKVNGPMTEAMKFINLMPALKVAYRKSRKEIGEKYGLSYFKD